MVQLKWKWLFNKITNHLLEFLNINCILVKVNISNDSFLNECKYIKYIKNYT